MGDVHADDARVLGEQLAEQRRLVVVADRLVGREHEVTGRVVEHGAEVACAARRRSAGSRDRGRASTPASRRARRRPRPRPSSITSAAVRGSTPIARTGTVPAELLGADREARAGARRGRACSPRRCRSRRGTRRSPTSRSRPRWPRSPASSSAPSSVNGVRLMTKVLWPRPFTAAGPYVGAPRRTPAHRRLGRVPERTRQTYRLISADSHVNEPPDLWTDRVPAEYRDRAPRIERFDAGRRVGDRGRRRPDQLRHERVRRARARGDAGLDALRGHPPRRLRPRGAPRGDGPRRRRRRGPLPDAAPRQARSSPTTTPTTTTRWCARTTTGSPSTSSTRPSASAGSRDPQPRRRRRRVRRDRPRRRPARHPRRS